MSPRGGRTVLIVNACALCVACALAAESVYIVHNIVGNIKSGVVWSGVVWPDFVPALIMFIIRRKTFSYVFFFLYTLVALEQGLEASLIYVGNPLRYAQGIGNLQAFFAVISVICLAFYLVCAAFKMIATLVKPAPKSER